MLSLCASFLTTTCDSTMTSTPDVFSQSLPGQPGPGRLGIWPLGPELLPRHSKKGQSDSGGHALQNDMRGPPPGHRGPTRVSGSSPTPLRYLAASSLSQN